MCTFFIYLLFIVYREKKSGFKPFFDKDQRSVFDTCLSTQRSFFDRDVSTPRSVFDRDSSTPRSDVLTPLSDREYYTPRSSVLRGGIDRETSTPQSVYGVDQPRYIFINFSSRFFLILILRFVEFDSLIF